MATDFSEYQYLADSFNRKYGLNFSFESFKNEVGTRPDNNGRIYKTTFVNLYKQALTNYADRKVHFFNSSEILEEYTKMMNGYKAVMKKEGTEIQWSKTSELVEEVRQSLNDPKTGIPDTKEEYIIKRYKEGNLPLRQMRAHAKELLDSGAKDPTRYSTILAYSNALNTINAQRPRWWRIIHPFRNSAEKRDARDLKKAVTDKLKIFESDTRKINGEHNVIGATKTSNTLTDDYVIARAVSQDTSLSDAKQEINNLSEQFKQNENALHLDDKMPEPDRKNIKVDEIALMEQKNKEKFSSKEPVSHYVSEMKKEEAARNAPKNFWK